MLVELIVFLELVELVVLDGELVEVIVLCWSRLSSG